MLDGDGSKWKKKEWFNIGDEKNYGGLKIAADVLIKILYTAKSMWTPCQSLSSFALNVFKCHLIDFNQIEKVTGLSS